MLVISLENVISIVYFNRTMLYFIQISVTFSASYKHGTEQAKGNTKCNAAYIRDSAKVILITWTIKTCLTMWK